MSLLSCACVADFFLRGNHFGETDKIVILVFSG